MENTIDTKSTITPFDSANY